MLKGKGVSNGIGIGKALILEEINFNIKDDKIENVDLEKQRFYNSLNNVISETNDNLKNLNEERKKIMEAYLQILQDPTLIQETLLLIENERYNVIYATEKGFNKTIDLFKNIDDEYISERFKDLEDRKNRIIKDLLNIKIQDISNLKENTIIIRKEITTSEISRLDFKYTAGIISEIGGKNSHVSIIARSKDIPLVVGVNYKEIKNDDLVIIDGKSGDVIINPSDEQYYIYKQKQDEQRHKKQELEQFKNKEAITADGNKVELVCNIGIPKDVEDVIKCNADGIGLFRTEFLFMDSDRLPTEEEQFNSYKMVAEKMEGKQVIIRTLDIGGDKKLKYLNLPKEENPFLGYRAIRICLEDIDLFKTQLRAILRASAFGNLAIMLPMISDIEELRKAKAIIQEVKQELENKSVEYKKDIKIGIMIEIPSAAIMANEFAKECDFFSIGTNDLIQYTVAAERGNTKVAKLYTKNHPAVIRLIKSAIDGAHNNGIWCGMCGEAASDEKFIPLLIGLGLDEFSVSSSEVLYSKQVISKLNQSDCAKLVQDILKLNSSDEVEKRLIGKFGDGS